LILLRLPVSRPFPYTTLFRSLAAATPGVGVMVIFPEKPAALYALAARLAGPKQKETLSLQEKMALAMSCDRELRFQFLRDPNKQDRKSTRLNSSHQIISYAVF